MVAYAEWRSVYIHPSHALHRLFCSLLSEHLPLHKRILKTCKSLKKKAILCHSARVYSHGLIFSISWYCVFSTFCICFSHRTKYHYPISTVSSFQTKQAMTSLQGWQDFRPKVFLYWHHLITKSYYTVFIKGLHD